MSVASLVGIEFRHRIQDDMESFYYVMLYCGVRWLPHKKVVDIKKQITSFFDEINDMGGKPCGGSFKHANIWVGDFHRLIGFTNAAIQAWFSKVLQLQRPFFEQPNWKPEILHEIWKLADDADLPNNDRIDNIPRRKTKVEKRRSKKCSGEGKLGKNKKMSEDKKDNEGEQLSLKAESRRVEPGTEEGKPRISSKRSADEAGVIEHGQSSKRLCPQPFEVTNT